MKWQVNEMTSRWKGNQTKGQIDEMTFRLNDKMARWWRGILLAFLCKLDHLVMKENILSETIKLTKSLSKITPKMLNEIDSC